MNFTDNQTMSFLPGDLIFIRSNNYWVDACLILDGSEFWPSESPLIGLGFIQGQPEANQFGFETRDLLSLRSHSFGPQLQPLKFYIDRWYQHREDITIGVRGLVDFKIESSKQAFLFASFNPKNIRESCWNMETTVDEFFTMVINALNLPLPIGLTINGIAKTVQTRCYEKIAILDDQD